MMNETPLIEFREITKTYPAVKALKGVSFAVRAGSIHALMGENGAGKSTLLKTLSGAHRPTSGSLLINGVAQNFATTAEAMAAGVAVIYQELHLVPELTVAENVYLGHLPAKAGVVDRKKLNANTRAQLKLLGEDIDPETKLSRLSIGQQQMVEIAKALSRGAKAIAFDEPTSSLSAREIDRLFSVICDLKRNGCAVLYVSHRMEEIFQLCDACTVLRDGGHIRTYESLSELTPATLVRDMVGRDISDVYCYRPRALGANVLEAKNILGPGVSSPTSLSVARGEIVGLFGLIGAGRTEFLKLLFGAHPRTGGTIRIAGVEYPINKPLDAIEAGLMYCTEDRKKEGIIPIRSVMENCNLSARRSHTQLGGIISENWERTNAENQITSLKIRTPSREQLIKNLSGGNQQKVILGRWLSENVTVLMLDEPTRGVDIGAKSEIYQLIFTLAEKGVGIVFVSSDLPEVLGISDRIEVMREGVICKRFTRAEASAESVLAAALPTDASRLSA